MIARRGSQARCGLSRGHALLFGAILHGRSRSAVGRFGAREGPENHLSGLDLNQRFLLQSAQCRN
jgi:hypothetical protein